MVVFLLSLAGIPPLFGFFGKALLFGAALEAGFLWLAIIAILNSVLALAVYLRVVVAMYGPAEGAQPSANLPATLVWVISLGVTLGMGLVVRVFLT